MKWQIGVKTSTTHFNFIVYSLISTRDLKRQPLEFFFTLAAAFNVSQYLSQYIEYAKSV